MVDERRYEIIASNRVSVETGLKNLFQTGQFKALSFGEANIFTITFSWLCSALTIFHCYKHPPRSQGKEYFERHKNRLIYIGNDIWEKRKQVQERFRNKCQRRCVQRYSNVEPLENNNNVQKD